MIDTYVDCVEYKRLVEDKGIRAASLKSFYKSNHMVFTSTSSTTLANQVYTAFLGVNDLTALQAHLFGEGTYEKSVLLKVNATDDAEIIDTISDALNAERSISTGSFQIDRPQNIDGGLFLEMTYTKKNSSKNRLMEDEPRTMRIYIRRVDSKKAVIDIRPQSAYDAAKALDMFEHLSLEDSGEKVFTLTHLGLSLLSKDNRVKFFDDIMMHKFTQWQLKTVSSITVKRFEPSVMEDDEEDVIEDAQELSSISQAVLNGHGLRQNEFVNTCLEQGFYISSMKLRYEKTDEATEFIIGISFKSDDLKVDMCRSFNTEDGKPEHRPMIRSDQDIIIKDFQDMCKTVYGQLAAEQKSAPNLTIE